MRRENNEGLSLNEIAIPILALAAFTALCYFAAVVLVPVITSIALAYALWPAVAQLNRWRFPHLLSVIIVMLVTVVLLSLIGYLVYSQTADFVQNYPEHIERLRQLRDEKFSNLPAPIDTLVDEKLTDLESNLDVSSLSHVPKYLFKGVTSVLSFLGSVSLVLLLTLFVLIEQPSYSRRLKHIFGRHRAGVTGTVVDEVSARFSKYVWARFLETIALTVIFSVGFLLFGVRYAYIWGPLAAVINLVPYVGAVAGGIPPMIMALIQYDSLTIPLLVFAFTLVVQFVESNLIMPRMFQDSLNVSLFAQLVATVYWGWLWGALGIILAVPITAAVKVFCDNVEALKPLGILLSGDKN